jgi:pyruvate/2-oxoglutarate dehydrogenase complex dihydrolipoamide dehydrogenase (E3) component
LCQGGARLATDVDAVSLRGIDAQVVVFATGAIARHPYLDIADGSNVCTVSDVLSGRVVPRGRCVVLDETGYTPGSKTSDFLADAGHPVEIVTRQYSLGESIGTTLRAPLYERLVRKGVVITTLHAPVRVDPDGVRLRHVLTGTERTVPADTVVFASGGRADDALYEAYVAVNGEERAYLVGDAFAPRHLRTAIADGARVGRAI